ncbi:hypothetical protein V6N13_045676 [Hibiscus sabdariffa]|uniref:Uncharacterized protein n=2 Tax=Hibiscus sabdariffa TaxID=183260 RepID=A0ABR2BFL4_9ROSI
MGFSPEVVPQGRGRAASPPTPPVVVEPSLGFSATPFFADHTKNQTRIGLERSGARGGLTGKGMNELWWNWREMKWF